MNKWEYAIEFLRALPRPFITIIFCGVIAQVVVERIDAPEWFIGLSVTVIGYWFIDRSIQRRNKNKRRG